MLPQDLKSDIDQLLDRFSSAGITNPLAAVEQITFLILIKDLEVQLGPIVPEDCRWSLLKSMNGELALALIQGPVFEWLKQVPALEEMMRDAVCAVPTAELLAATIDVIDRLFASTLDSNARGEMYRYLVSGRPAAGRSGQFRTPLHIIRAMCCLLDPQPDELACDPASRFGDLPIMAFQYMLMRRAYPETLNFESDGAPVDLAHNPPDFVQREIQKKYHFRGFDSDRTMVRLGSMNLIMNGLHGVRIGHGDVVSPAFLEHVGNDRFDAILTNAPFHGTVELADVIDGSRDLTTSRTELLFIDRVLQLLRDDGRAAVIVPDGVLTGSSGAHRALRERLLTKNQVNAIVSLPSGVFQPYSAVKTSILLFTRGGSTDRVWFYDVSADGFTLNARRAEQPLENDLWDLVLAYRAAQFGRSAVAPAYAARGNWFKATALPAYDQGVAVISDGRAVAKPAYAQPRIDNGQYVSGTGDLTLPSYVVEVPAPVSTPMYAGLDLIPLDEPKHWFVDVAEIARADYNLSAARYKPSATTTTQDSPSEIIRQLQALESQMREDLDRLLAMVEDRE